MSRSAAIFFLTPDKPSVQRLGELSESISNRIAYPLGKGSYGGHEIVGVDDMPSVWGSVDRYVEIDSKGFLHWFTDPKPNIDSTVLEGRLHLIFYSTRFWSTDYPQGPLLKYATTLLTLLSQPDISRVWYTTGTFEEGCCIEPMTRDAVHKLIDDFIRIGENNSSGEKVRYIRDSDGCVIGV